jgi:hypothetical protein
MMNANRLPLSASFRWLESLVRRVYLAVLGLLFLAILFQFYLAGVGAFDVPHDDGSFAWHRFNGMVVITGLSVLATIAAALARVGIRTVALTLLPGLLVVVQMLIRAIAEAFNDSVGDTTTASDAIFGLHVLNGMLIMLVTVALLRNLRKQLAAARAGAQVAGDPAAVGTSGVG